MLIYWKRPWCWERWKAKGEGVSRGWDGWMASPSQWAWIFTSWATRGALNGHEFEQTLGRRWGQRSWAYCSPRGHRVRHDLPAEQQGGLNNKLPFHSSRSSEVQDQTSDRSCVWWGPFPGLQMIVFSYPQMTASREEVRSLRSLRLLIPSWGLHPHDLITSPRHHLQISSHWGSKFRMNLGVCVVGGHTFSL